MNNLVLTKRWQALPELVYISFTAVESWRRVAAVLPAAGAAVLVVAPAIDIFFQFAQPRPGNPDSQILFIVAVPAGLFVMAAELVRSISRRCDIGR